MHVAGDIDLYVELEDQPDSTRKKIDFLVTLKRKIGARKIDVVIDRKQNRPIDRKAKEEGVLLWPKS